MRPDGGRMMPKSATKDDFPVSRVRQYLEPGPIVLISSRWEGKTNIMTLGWHTVMEFSPSLVGCVISAGNHSYNMIRKSGECVINLPTTKLTDTVVGIGNTSGSHLDKFEHFKLTADKATEVEAPLIRECHANFECKLHDDTLADPYNFLIFEVVKAHVMPKPKYPETLHYTGDGVFTLSGKAINLRKLFTKGV
jgi:flavin reductase (DIM6/NTAB) family NADH-FMN oxidoreductase RutF